jgi:uncharacterized protein (DUF2384 family)
MTENKKKEMKAKIHSLALRHFSGSFQELTKWLKAPDVELEGKTPISLMEKHDYEPVIKLLEKMGKK